MKSTIATIIALTLFLAFTTSAPTKNSTEIAAPTDASNKNSTELSSPLIHGGYLNTSSPTNSTVPREGKLYGYGVGLTVGPQNVPGPCTPPFYGGVPPAFCYGYPGLGLGRPGYGYGYGLGLGLGGYGYPYLG